MNSGNNSSSKLCRSRRFREVKTTSSAPAKRTMSVAARRKIAAALRARWAKIRAQQKKAA
jgi:hypothetical protein